jgi:hypothetical protein
VKLDERVSILPVAPWCMPTIDKRDVHIGVIDQGVGERHPHSTGTDDDVVRAERARRHDGRECMVIRRRERWLPGAGGAEEDRELGQATQHESVSVAPVQFGSTTGEAEPGESTDN